jgi:hypothetical protein
LLDGLVTTIALAIASTHYTTTVINEKVEITDFSPVELAFGMLFVYF